MIDTPQVVHTRTQLLARIHVTVPRSEIQRVMGPGLGELQAAVAAQGIGVTGPWFTHHLKITPDTFDFEICLPVTAPVKAVGRVTAGEWPAMKVAQTLYRGPYEGLAAAWPELDAWINRNGHKGAPDLWERYVAGPESGPDPATWRTELTRPLTD